MCSVHVKTGMVVTIHVRHGATDVWAREYIKLVFPRCWSAAVF
jgi:hypothetical protein